MHDAVDQRAQLGRGVSIEQATSEMRMVAEGVRAAKAAHTLANRLGLELPITAEIYRVLYEQKPVPEALRDLMNRDLKPEWSE